MGQSSVAEEKRGDQSRSDMPSSVFAEPSKRIGSKGKAGPEESRFLGLKGPFDRELGLGLPQLGQREIANRRDIDLTEGTQPPTARRHDLRPLQLCERRSVGQGPDLPRNEVEDGLPEADRPRQCTESEWTPTCREMAA